MLIYRAIIPRLPTERCSSIADVNVNGGEGIKLPLHTRGAHSKVVRLEMGIDPYPIEVSTIGSLG
jgi:hypothetical protein